MNYKREICFDTETTGLSPISGDRIVEIGAVELINKIRTGRQFHSYINPERDVPIGAFKVHGLSADFLSDKPLFYDITIDFLEFIGDDDLVAHNASFDIGFLNNELARVNRQPISSGRVIDTLAIARQKFPSSKASLDALCHRFSINTSLRKKHGALLDAELLADVYLELTIGSQQSLFALDERRLDKATREIEKSAIREVRNFIVSKEEMALHRAFVNQLEEPLWHRHILWQEKN